VLDQIRAAEDVDEIAIGDQRIVATSAVVSDNGRILVNGHAVTPPYVIRVIGNSGGLTAALEQPGGALAAIRRSGASARVEPGALLHLPAYIAPVLRFARTTVVPAFQEPHTGGPSGQTITLADGTGVELIAVGSSPTGYGDDWWRPDGTLLTEAPVRTNNRFHNSYGGIGTQYLARCLFFRLHAPNERDASTTGVVVDPTRHLDTDGSHHGRDDRMNNTRLIADMPASGTVVLGFPKSEARCTYRFGIATGPWETIAMTRPPVQPARNAASPRTEDLSGTILLDERPAHITGARPEGPLAFTSRNSCAAG